MPDGVHADPGLVRRAGAGGDDDATRFKGGNLVDGDLVVAMNLHLGTQLAEILHEVVGETVVVVDH